MGDLEFVLGFFKLFNLIVDMLLKSLSDLSRSLESISGFLYLAVMLSRHKSLKTTEIYG